MGVYMDNYQGAFGRMSMSHMIADTLPELHAFANRIGLLRSWFQGQASFPHYDVCKSKRKLAIELGARALDRNEFVLKMREIRAREGKVFGAAVE